MNTALALFLFIAIMIAAGMLLARISRSGEETSGEGTPDISSEKSDGERGAAHGSAVVLDASSADSPARTPQKIDRLIDAVNAKLPQTQCAQCGHPGCRPYATALVLDDAPINLCPPGGDALIRELASFLGRDCLPLDESRGTRKPPQTAVIDESSCIGCTLCIAACPVDAIVGASRFMHTVLSTHCTGCELCLPPCPVDCISLQPIDTPLNRWRWSKPA